ncbi:MAG TPA: hypothetical protein ENH40_00185 [Nitrospirae bacterium]|nr:hypothetical protein [Nitrospirota bacterium]
MSNCSDKQKLDMNTDFLKANQKPTHNDIVRIFSVMDESGYFQCKLCHYTYMEEEQFKKHNCFIELASVIERV